MVRVEVVKNHPSLRNTDRPRRSRLRCAKPRVEFYPALAGFEVTDDRGQVQVLEKLYS
jgi:hypothetical protein